MENLRSMTGCRLENSIPPLSKSDKDFLYPEGEGNQRPTSWYQLVSTLDRGATEIGLKGKKKKETRREESRLCVEKITQDFLQSFFLFHSLCPHAYPIPEGQSHVTANISKKSENLSI